MSDIPNGDPPRHFTVQSLARHWGVSPSHIYNLINSNAIRHLRIGKAIRIPVDFIKQFEEQACQQTEKNTDFGNMRTESSTSLGQREQGTTANTQNAFQRGQLIGQKPKNSDLNLLRD